MEGMNETVQLAGVAANFSAELMRVGMEGTNVLFRGAEGITRGIYALIRMGIRQHEEHEKDPAHIRKGSYEMYDMMKMCTRKGVKPGFMRISTSAYEEFTRYAKDNKLAYSVLPDLNTHDSYIEIMYPGTQQVQFVNFQNNINKRQATSISFENYINGADAEHQADMEQMINSLSDEEKEILKTEEEKAEKREASEDTPIEEAPEIPYEKEINVYDDQVNIPEEGDIAQIALVDESGRDCSLAVSKAALTKTDAGYTVRLNAKEQVRCDSAAEIRISKDMIVKETAGQYITAVPGTHGERFAVFDKKICSQKGEGDLVVYINRGEKYQLLDKSYSFVTEITGRNLFSSHYSSRMTTAAEIEEYNKNYAVREGRIEKEPQAVLKDGTPDQPENRTFYAELDRSMTGSSIDGSIDIRLSDGSFVMLKTDDIIESTTPSGPKYFARLDRPNYIVAASGGAKHAVSGGELAVLIRKDRAKLMGRAADAALRGVSDVVTPKMQTGRQPHSAGDVDLSRIKIWKEYAEKQTKQEDREDEFGEKQKKVRDLTVEDIQNIHFVKKDPGEEKWYFTCDINGEPDTISYSLQYDFNNESYSYRIRSEKNDIRNRMPADERASLAEILSDASEFGQWEQLIQNAADLEELQGIKDDYLGQEHPGMSVEHNKQILDLIEAREVMIKEAPHPFTKRTDSSGRKRR